MILRIAVEPQGIVPAGVNRDVISVHCLHRRVIVVFMVVYDYAGEVGSSADLAKRRPKELDQHVDFRVRCTRIDLLEEGVHLLWVEQQTPVFFFDRAEGKRGGAGNGVGAISQHPLKCVERGGLGFSGELFRGMQPLITKCFRPIGRYVIQGGQLSRPGDLDKFQHHKLHTAPQKDVLIPQLPSQSGVNDFGR